MDDVNINDNAPTRKSEVLMKFLDEADGGIKFYCFPPCTLGPNPMGPLWMVHEKATGRHMCENVEEVQESLRTMHAGWEGNPGCKSGRMSGSLTARVQKVLSRAALFPDHLHQYPLGPSAIQPPIEYALLPFQSQAPLRNCHRRLPVRGPAAVRGRIV